MHTQTYTEAVLREVDVNQPVVSISWLLRCGVHQKPARSHAKNRKAVIDSDTSYVYITIIQSALAPLVTCTTQSYSSQETFPVESSAPTTSTLFQQNEAALGQ